MNFTMKKLTAALALATVGLSSVALASGFQLWEESAAGTGDYHAGGAAEADNSSTEFYNPAGMVRLKHPEVSVGGVFIPLGVKFKGETTLKSTGSTVPTNGWVNGGTNNIVPNMHFVYPINSKMAFGFGVTVPFGLATNFPGGINDLGVALSGTVTKLQAINFNPSFAYAITPKLSVGAGVDVVYGRAVYDSMVITTPFTNKLHDTSFGWNAGVLYQLSPRTRFGVAYRSKVVLHAKGTSTLGTVATSDDLYARMVLPSTLTISAFQQVNPKWDVMASAYYTQWNVFSDLILHNTALPSYLGGATVNVHENYKNTWNFAVGAHYHFRPDWTLKFGAGYDKTPTQDGHRDVRLPDTNRIAAAIGLHFDYSKSLGVDFGWTHFFTKKVAINNSQAGKNFPTVDVGVAKMQADVIGAELSWKFDAA